MGAVAVRAPNPPAIIIAPLDKGRCSLGNQSTKDLNEAIKHAETPSPMKERPIIRFANVSDEANIPAPSAAIISKAASTFRGPTRSRIIPRGI